MSFKRKFFRNLLLSASFNYSAQGIAFLSTIITSRLLSPQVYGFVGLITVFTGFLTVFTDSGISLAVIRSDLGYSYHKSVDNLALYLGGFLCICTCLAAFPVSLIFNNRMIILPMMAMSLNFIFKSMTIVRMALLTKNLRFTDAGKVTLYTMVANVLFTIILALLGLGYWSLIIAPAISNLYALFLLERKVKLGFRFYPIRYIVFALKHTRKTVGNLMGFNMVNYWARNTDNLIVGRFYGVESLGIYNRAYTLLTIPLTLITSLIGTVLYPSLSKIKNDIKQIKKEYMFILKVITFLSYPITLLLVEFSHGFVMILFGKNWIMVSTLLPYFGLLIFTQSLLSTAGNLLVLVNEEPVLRKSGFAGAIIMISGICYGAMHSLIAVAQFYSLSFIICVLPFNVYYIYIKTLKYKVSEMLIFWGPIIFVNLYLWIACYTNNETFKIMGLSALLVVIIINSFAEFKNLMYNKRVIPLLK